MKARVGDWIRFYHNGKLVIGQVEYITKDWAGRDEYNTDVGLCSFNSVLEVRTTI